jgi:lipooligosaccharide transport system permease protein
MLISFYAAPRITLVAFGYGLGSMIGRVDGLPYVTYLASGSIAVSCTLAATFEALYSAFSRMHVQKTWESIMNAPIALDDIVFAEMLWAALKSLFSVAAIMAVIWALARGYDFFTYYFTLVLTPMTFLSGVYFPITQMPDWLQAVARVLPLTAAVEIVRPLIIGEMPGDWLTPLLVLGAYALGGYYLALVLTRRRFFR